MDPTASAPIESEIVLSRIFRAPRELVWRAMTDPVQVVHWWGPNGFSTTIETMDFRIGGVWKHVMHSPDGADYPNSSVFREIVEHERVVYSHGGGREGGSGAHFTASWTFEALDESTTRLTVRMVFDTPEQRALVVREYGAIEGGRQTLARLGGFLPAPTPLPFTISRLLDAPRERVWAAWTEEQHLQSWFGPKGVTIPVCRLDLRPGGRFHYCMQMPNGSEMWGRWTFLEIEAPERLVLISAFSDAKGGLTRHPMSASWPLETLSMTHFAEQDGGTLLTIEWSPYRATDEERRTFDAAHGGMQQGWTGTFEQLQAYLAASSD